MLARVRRFLDIRPGETLPVLATFIYIAVVIAAFLLAKSIRSGLFLKEYGAYALPYVYAAVPLAVSAFVPLSNRLTNRYGQRVVAVWTLVFFAANALLFWYGFHASECAAVSRRCPSRRRRSGCARCETFATS